MAESPNCLFVYGTLLHAARNGPARRLWAAAELAGKATARGRLYGMGAYPAMTEARGDGELVHGQVARLRDPAVLAELDEYEGPEYRRVVVEAVLETGQTVEAWAYVYTGPVEEAARIREGRWVQ
ncbi:MAG: gamma-glutamylcyclotransferase [Candidatus Solibacter usitatus]|nr:gamma-glutamylcyclotransferase [Candidatus Solibacter usitatus]